ncbi:MAG: c-type cytochrome [bacterium]
MTGKKSRAILWLGLGLLVVGIAGLYLSRTGGRHMASFSGWGGGGVFDKGSYASNGERIYYLGIDADGQLIPFKGGPHWLRGIGGSCVNCHGPEGKGGLPVMMGTHIPGDIRYSALVSGRHHGEAEGEEKGEEQAYTDADIKRAIREGIEPSGEKMDKTMPRWKISDQDLDDLLDYLRELG